MRRPVFTLLLLLFYTCSFAQNFEGILQIDYRAESGNNNAIDVYVKGDRFFMKKVFGGCDRYDSYVYDTRTGIFSCLSPQSPKTALSLDIIKVLGIYEQKQLKPSFKVHVPHAFTASALSRQIANLKAVQKKADEPDATYEIWTTNLKVNFNDLIPVLRVIGFWGDVEDSDSAILESKITSKKTSKISTINVTPVKTKVEESLFNIPADYQQVDLDKFLVNEYKSPRFGELVKAFTGF